MEIVTEEEVSLPQIFNDKENMEFSTETFIGTFPWKNAIFLLLKEKCSSNVSWVFSENIWNSCFQHYLKIITFDI